MKDKAKTKDQLLKELAAMRHQVLRMESPELRKTSDYLENVLENSPDGIGIVDSHGRFLKWNKMAEELYGYSYEELKGKKAFDLYANPLDLENMLRQLRRDEVVKRNEIDMKRKDGSIVPFEISISLLRNNKKNIIGSVCVARDLSDIKKALTALKESNDQLNREILERQRVEEELQQHREHLEDLVAARTSELRRTNKKLRQEIAERQQAEEALGHAEGKYRDIFENAIEGIFQTTPDGRFITANPALAHILGYDSPEELVKTVTAIQRQVYVDPGRRGEIARRLEDRGMVQFFEAQLYRKDRSKIWVSISGRGVFDLEGAMQYFEGTLVDITQRKQAEINLQKKDQQLLQAQQLAQLGSWTYDPVTNASEWSPEMYRIFGRGPADGPPSYPEEYRQFTHADDWETVDAAFQAALRAGKGFDLELRIVRPNGELRHIITKAQGFRKADGTVERLFGTVLDITVRRRAEEAFRTLVLNAPIGLFIAQDAKFKQINPEFQKITGYDPEELLNNDCLCLIIPEFREKVREKAIQILQGKSFLPFEFQYLNKAGETRWALEKVATTQYEGERATLGYFMDITDSKHMEAQFLQAQKMEAVGRLAGGVAHDFNNLLTGILGYGELMLFGLQEGDPHRRYLEEIIKTTERAAALTRQLLAFGRKQIIQPRIINLNAVISGMEKMLRRLLGEDLDLVTLLEPALGAVKADPGQMDQVIMNLAVNARDAMPRGGLLTVETKNVFLDDSYAREHLEVSPGPYVLLAVSDSGSGIDPENQAHIFEPFFTTKEPGKGTGLGLATVHGIIKQSGGHIWVYSEPGKGTTFKIYLPRVAEAAIPVQTAAASAASLRGPETILVAEDDEKLRRVICQTLRAYGYTVLEASHGNKAIAVFKRHQGSIHLLLTDVVMPGMSGGELIERLSPFCRQMQVLFMSGYTEDTAALQSLLAAGVPFLEKPFKMINLIKKVREVLDTPLTLSP
jgi:two-component system cell cycle sensor histidine kinase/response regulator CckA